MTEARVTHAAPGLRGGTQNALGAVANDITQVGTQLSNFVQLQVRSSVCCGGKEPRVLTCDCAHVRAVMHRPQQWSSSSWK